jgi:hypothetical protein
VAGKSTAARRTRATVRVSHPGDASNRRDPAVTITGSRAGFRPSFWPRRGREAGVVASGGEGKHRPSRPRRGRRGGLRKKRILYCTYGRIT